MKPARYLTACLLAAVAAAGPSARQNNAQRIAIIGAGPGGTSTAYWLHKLANESGTDVEITLIEKYHEIGGRVRETRLWDNPNYPVEIAASLLYTSNWILNNITEELGLSTRRPNDPSGAAPQTLWNGTGFPFTIEGSGPWNTAKLLNRYGVESAAAIQTLAADVNKRYTPIYSAPLMPWTSLTDVVTETGIANITNQTGPEFLSSNGVSDLFINEIASGSVRQNLCQNIKPFNGFLALAVVTSTNYWAITGGNSLLFKGMAKLSGANVQLNTTATSLSLDEASKKWQLGTTTTTTGAESGQVSTAEYDHVVLSAPLHLSGVTISPALPNPPPAIPYVNLHITIFSTPYRVKPQYFIKNSTDVNIPDGVQTVLGADEQQDDLVGGGGDVGSNHWFWALLMIRSVDRPVKAEGVAQQGLKREFVYKIYSPEAVSDEQIAELLGLSADADADMMSYIHRSQWDAYPQYSPSATFPDAKLADNLWYTSGMEALGTSMESSAIGGKNVALNIQKTWG